MTVLGKQISFANVLHEKLYNLRKSASDLVSSDPDEALKVGEQARRIAKTLNDTDEIIAILHVFALAYAEKGLVSQQVRMLRKIAVLYDEKNNKEAAGNIYLEIAILCSSLKKEEDSNEAIESAKACFEKIELADSALRIKEATAKIYLLTGKYAPALKIYLEIAPIYEKLEGHDKLVPIWQQISRIYYLFGDFDEAHAYLQQVLKIQEQKDTVYLKEYYADLAAVLEEKQEWKAALEFRTKGLEFVSEINEEVLIEQTLIAYLQYKIGTQAPAAETLMTVLQESKALGLKHISCSAATYLIYFAHELNEVQRSNFQNLLDKFGYNDIDIALKEIETSISAMPLKLKQKICEILIAYYERTNDYRSAFEYQKILTKIYQSIDEGRRLLILNSGVLDLEVVDSDSDAIPSGNEKEESGDAFKEYLAHFAHAISHDMKEPLRMITSFGQLLNRRAGKNLDTQSQEFLEFIMDASERMTILLQDMLNYTTLDRLYTNKKEPVNLHDILVSTKHTLRTEIKESKAIIKVNEAELVNVRAHYGLISQLFQHILHNAIKFRTPEKVPEIEIKCKKRSKDFIITFTDNGIGIKEEYLDTIFQILKRLHSKKVYPGSGIGLATCRKIIGYYKGKIWATSTFGKGTTIHIQLPK